jgi:hypothetical protein
MKYSDKSNDLDNQIYEANKELIDNDLNTLLNQNIKVYSRDWTIQTIYDQITRGNIDLNPKFQRRNAWDDQRRSLLIESLLLDLPVPEIVLAENHEIKDTFIVLDGKQRLLTILGFIDHDKTKYWTTPKLVGLEIKNNLNGKTYQNMIESPDLMSERRAFDNASIRCTVIFNQQSDDLLYQIFYRLNVSTVPLCMQELRQALRRGHFSNFLMEITNDANNLQPIHHVLGLDEPDKRLLDAEIILKFIAFRLFGKAYNGNLKVFLDNAMKTINSNWKNYEAEIKKRYDEFNQGIHFLQKTFGKYEKVGRLDGQTRFNRNVFDVQVLYFSTLAANGTPIQKNFVSKYADFCKKNTVFTKALHAGTSTKNNYINRFKSFESLVNDVFQTNLNQTFINYE